jgi:3-oxoacyl-[acyl-carrier protein] reductase
MVAINLRAVFAAVQAVLPHMTAGGRIITTGSVTADRIGFPGASVYGMTKGAVAASTRGLARDLGPRGITLNVIQPRPTETDMNVDGNTREVLRPLMAVGRMGDPQEIASLVAFLAGPESSFITGSALTIDAGYYPDRNMNPCWVLNVQARATGPAVHRRSRRIPGAHAP